MGAFSIRQNIAALYAQSQLGLTSANLIQSTTRLSSCTRINSGADDALATIRSALLAAANTKAAVGAGSNRLQSAVSVMQNQSLNTQAAESTIHDANMAQEISILTNYQIPSRTRSAALAQANATSKTILSLIQGLK